MTQFINPFSVLRHFNMIVRDSGGGGGGNNDNDSGSSDPGSGTGDDGWGDWDDTADWGQDNSNDSYDYGYDNNDNDNNDYYYDEPSTPIAPPSTPTPYEPPGYDFGGGNNNDTTSPTDESNVYDYYTPPVSYPAPPPEPTLPDDRNFDWDYGPTPFEGPATDDDLGLTDAPISDYRNTEDTYAPNIMDPQTDDDLGFETPIDTIDIFGPEADLLQDPVTGYIRPMTTQEIEQGALETRLSYAAPDNVLNQDIGDLSSATFDTGAAITGTSPTDTTDMTKYLLEAYNYPPVPFSRNTDTSNFNIGGFDTGPDVDTTAPSGLTGSTGLLGDPINLGTVSPTDQSGMGVEFDSTTPNAGFTNAPGVGTETPATPTSSPSGYNPAIDADNYNESFDPTGVSDPTGLYSSTDLDLGTGTTVAADPTTTAGPLSLELTDPASGLDYADGSPNNIAIDDAIASIAIGRDLDNADEPVLDPDTGKQMFTDKGKPITYGVAPRFSGGGFAGFIQDLISYVVKGATYGIVDINKMDEKYKEKLWDAYQAGGTWAYDEKGKIVGITDENGKLLNIGGGGAVENDGNGGDGTGIVNVCEPGYILIDGVCVPDDSLGTGGGGGGGSTGNDYNIGNVIRPSRPLIPVEPDLPANPPLLPPRLRTAKQFAMGGEVSPGLVTAADRFLASLKG